MTENTLMTSETVTSESTAEPQASPQPGTGRPADNLSASPAAPHEPTADKPEKPAVPEKYDDFIMPENVTLDPQASQELKGLAKEYSLTQTQAQKAADLGAKMMQKWTSQQTEAITRAQTEWMSSAKSDTEFGGGKLQENLGLARKALDTFGTPKLTQLLEGSGLGNYPEIIRAFYRAGKAISADRFVSGEAGFTDTRHAAEKLYPDQSKS